MSCPTCWSFHYDERSCAPTRLALWQKQLRRRAAAALWIAIAASGCGKVVQGDAPDAGAPTIDGAPAKSVTPTLELSGCASTPGDRPPSTSAQASPSLSHLALGQNWPGQPLSGSVKFAVQQSNVTALIVQIDGAAGYLTCAASAADLQAKQFDLGKLTVSAGSGPGSFPVYFAALDAAGNISGYLMTTVVLGPEMPVPVCGRAAPLQILGKAPSVDTQVFADANGTTANYLVGSATGPALAIMRQARLYMDVGSCGHLYLAGDRAGVKPMGWDNLLLVEARGAPSGTVTGAWYYSGESDIVAVHASPTLVHADNTTVPGDMLDPPVPDGNPYGYAPMSLDLMARVPPVTGPVELTFYALDAGGLGSTTDLWLFAK